MLSIPPLYPIAGAAQKLSLSKQVLRFADAGFPLVQFRGKQMAPVEQWRELRLSLLQASENGGWPLIVVNDRADLAILAARDGLEPWGLHLGQADIPAFEAARLPGLENLHFGASTHNPDEWSSVDGTCDHAGVGPFRATSTKQDHDEIIGIEGLEKGCAALRRQNIAPIAIGGLAMDDAPQCFQAGAESLAMAQALAPGALGAPGDSARALADCLWQAQKIKYSTRPIIKRGSGIAIVGGSGAGKTTLADSIAQRMGLRAVDLDLVISNKSGKPIAEIFDNGEAPFRDLELECLPECLEQPSVLALGAGAWQQEPIRQCVKKSGWSVLWLAEDPRIAWGRVMADPGRPLAKDRESFMQRWRSRTSEWSVLPTVLPLGRPPEAIAQILAPWGETATQNAPSNA